MQRDEADLYVANRMVPVQMDPTFLHLDPLFTSDAYGPLQACI